MKDVNQRIVKLMEVQQVTARRFASEIGIQASTVSNIVNERNNPSLEVLQRILSTYPSVSPDWLILGSGSMYREINDSQQLKLFDIEPIEKVHTSDTQALESSRRVSESQIKKAVRNTQSANQANSQSAIQANSQSAVQANSQSANQAGDGLSDNDDIDSREDGWLESGLNDDDCSTIRTDKRRGYRSIKKVVILYDDGSYEEISNR